MPDKILVDTSVWTAFFRRKGSPISLRLREWLKLNQVYYTGSIAVELYQGAKTTREIQIIDHLLQAINYIEITRAHYHHACLISRKAARHGKIFSVVDMILTVVAHDEQLLLVTLDKHFKEISEFCPLSLSAVQTT